MKVLAAYNIKGGVGKTSAAVNLAWLAAAGGARTLICDLDPQGAATWCFRVRMKVRGGGRKLVRGKGGLARHVRETDYEGLDLLPADFSYRHLDLLLDSPKYVRRLTRRIRELGAGYDYVFLDCAPSISLASEAVFRVADALIVPTIPTTLSIRTYAQLLVHAKSKKLKPAIVPFFSMADRRRRLHRDVMLEFADRAPECCRTFIPYATEVEQMGPRRMPVTAFSPASAPSRAFRELWAQVARRLGVQG